MRDAKPLAGLPDATTRARAVHLQAKPAMFAPRRGSRFADGAFTPGCPTSRTEPGEDRRSGRLGCGDLIVSRLGIRPAEGDIAYAPIPP
jgi:hypothetical protein